MGAYRYCTACGNGQDRITLEEIETAITRSEHVQCGHCGADRGDDDFAERFLLLLEEVIRLRGVIDAIVESETKP